MTELSLGVVGTARKQGEQRLPVHPDHFNRIPQRLRRRIHFERGYGIPFGVPDDEILSHFGSMAAREEILGRDIVLLPKPLPEDLAQMRPGSIQWGWPHCVQQTEIAQTAIDRKLTLIAWESMFTWRGGLPDHHLFYKNNELAGYSAVVHALQLAGEDGHYGPDKRAIVLSFGSVSRGAVYALIGRGYSNLTIYTQRPPWAVRDPLPGCQYGQMAHRDGGGGMVAIDAEGGERPLIEVFEEADIIVNGILQDTDRPLMYMAEGEESRLRRGCLIVDVSCDLGMGFHFARPTSFAEPTLVVGPASYYAVDHTPTYLWKSATWEISAVVCQFLPLVMEGPEAWKDEPILSRAVEIEEGRVRNPKILTFQGRAEEYPHPIK